MKPMLDMGAVRQQEGYAKPGEYPKRIAVSCYCHVKNMYALQHADPAPDLCRNCRNWAAFFAKQYEDECVRLGSERAPIQGFLV